MNATRIIVEWMTHVPKDEVGDSDFDRATWKFREFLGHPIKAAREFAQREANRNKFGQVWLYVEHAPRADAPDYQWERDTSADEIIEAEPAGATA